jgi:hypothetical protein
MRLIKKTIIIRHNFKLLRIINKEYIRYNPMINLTPGMDITYSRGISCGLKMVFKIHYAIKVLQRFSDESHKKFP